MVIRQINNNWIECNECLRSTKHDILTEHLVEEIEDMEGNTFHWNISHQLLMCRGCESVSYRRLTTGDVFQDGYGQAVYYPPRISRQLPRWSKELPDEFNSLMKECYNALHNDSSRLAVMGARALVDLFMNETIGDIGGFKAKLEKLVEKDYISRKDRDILESALDTGHAAIHRGHYPDPEEVNTVFDIVESLLHKLILEKKSRELKKNTPPRTKS